MPIPMQNLMDALNALKKNKIERKFDPSVELIVKLREVDLKRPENRINETVELPNPPDKHVTICVLSGGEMASRAKRSEVDGVLGREDIENIGKDKKRARKLAQQYDFFLAEAPLMPIVGKTLGAYLGPRAKMPTPLPPNAPIEEIIQKHKRMVRIRARDQPVIQCRIGTESMADDKLAQNIQTIISSIESKLSKGIRNISKVLLKTTMSPAVPVNLGKG